jgi:DNA ligase-1
VKTFAALYRRLDSGTSTRAKQAAMVEFFAAAKADPAQWASAAWTVYFLSGGKPRQTAPSASLAPGSRGLGLSRVVVPSATAPSVSPMLPCFCGRHGRRRGFARCLDARAAAASLIPEEERYASLSNGPGAASDERLAFSAITGELRVGVSRLQVVGARSQHDEGWPRRSG